MAGNPTHHYLNHQIGVDVVASCLNCRTSSDGKSREREYSNVRNRLKELVDSNLHLGQDIEFTKDALNACKNCDYSSSKVVEMVREALGKSDSS